MIGPMYPQVVEFSPLSPKKSHRGSCQKLGGQGRRQGVASGMNGLHENEPAEGEPMVAFPNARHAFEMSGDESR